MAPSWKIVHTKVWGRKYAKNVFVRSNPDDLKFIFMEINIMSQSSLTCIEHGIFL